MGRVKNAVKCLIKQTSKIRFTLVSPNKEIRKYYINDVHGLKQLEANQKGKHKFKYDFEANKKSKTPKLLIAENALMNGGLGVYADQNIKKTRKSIGHYAGKRSKRGGDVNSLYTFQISDNNNKVIEYINADKLRDWSAYINNSSIANLYVDQRKVNNKINIYFYLTRDIKKGEQLLYNYGDFYFTDANIKPFYIHASDNWLTSEDCYLQNQAYYARGKYKFDNNTRNNLELKFQNVTDFLLPSIFLSVYKNNPEQLKKQLKKSYPVDLLAYACEKKKISVNNKQQHLTALMFASYLGHEKLIQILLAHGADVDRRMLLAGYSPLTLLMLGHGDNATAEKIGSLLLQKMKYVTIPNYHQLTELHYAILRNSPVLVKSILKIYSKEDYDWMEPMYDRDDKYPHHANFDDCLKLGKLDILQSMLKTALENTHAMEKDIIDRINANHLFKYKTLLSVSIENLVTLEKILKKPAYRKLRKKTNLCSRLLRIISRISR